MFQSVRSASRQFHFRSLLSASRPLNSRQYASHANSPTIEKTSRSRDPSRAYPTRKANLHAQYLSLIQPKTHTESHTGSSIVSDQSPTVVLINFKNFTATQMTKLRTDLRAAAIKYNTSKAIQTGSFGSQNGQQSIELVTLRPGVFVPMVRSVAGHRASKRIKSLLKGQVAALVLHELNPPLLSQLLRILDKAVPPPPLEEKKKKPVDEFEVAEKPPAHPALTVVGAFMDGKAVLPEQRLRDVAKMPTLDTLRAQIIGLLGSPAGKLTEVIRIAGGAKVAMTLEGYTAGLRKEQEAGA
ncbi:hypothetical protein FRC02_007163 [Tulasnella sp. 418]|nr:hypothetical protein FRC02_007163 [Tulasnella sp. 418]